MSKSLIIGLGLLTSMIVWICIAPLFVSTPEIPKTVRSTVPQVEVQAALVPLTSSEYQLKIVATIPKGCHIYSINQKSGGPQPTRIELGPGAMVDREAKWTETPKPVIIHYDFLPGLDIETLSGQVEWTLNVSSLNSNEPLVITGAVTVYPCSDRGCLMSQTIKFTTE
jgi:hypothetical protein